MRQHEEHGKDHDQAGDQRNPHDLDGAETVGSQSSEDREDRADEATEDGCNESGVLSYAKIIDGESRHVDIKKTGYIARRHDGRANQQETLVKGKDFRKRPMRFVRDFLELARLVDLGPYIQPDGTDQAAEDERRAPSPRIDLLLRKIVIDQVSK